MRILYFLISASIFLFFSSLVRAQINGGSYDYADTSEYSVVGKADSIFIFNVNNADKYIEAFSPNGSSVSFNWEYYNPLSNSYEFLKSETDTISSLVITESMGYRLIITGTGIDDTSRCWTLINDFNVSIISTDEEKQIKDTDIRCGLIAQIEAKIDSSVMSYYNPYDHNQISYSARYQVGLNDWHPSPDHDFTMNIFQKLTNSNLLVAVEKPYWEDTWYVIEIEDYFGLVRKDSAFHESSQPHASFTKPVHVPLDDSIFYPNKSDRYYEIYGDDYDNAVSAPAIFLFQNESVNADEITWFFGDSTSIKTQEDTIQKTYQLPGIYYPMIVVTIQLPFNIDVCIDTFPDYVEIIEDPIEIIVEEPTVNIGEKINDSFGEWPNVFTPPNGEIKYFRFTGDVSITNFEIIIYNRYGKKVYKYQGNIRDWEGWDGTNKNSGKIVSTGVYYYVIKEMYELPVFNPDPIDPYEPITSEIKSGFLHVYNTE